MADVVERTVRVLHRLHDELVDLAGRLGEGEARAQSYCDEWSVAQVFSHLGSGAEIGREELSAALAGEDPPARENIWARWDTRRRACAPVGHRGGVVAHEGNVRLEEARTLPAVAASPCRSGRGCGESHGYGCGEWHGFGQRAGPGGGS
jgi:hypothetical protein